MTLSALGLFAGVIFMIGISPGPTVVALVARVITHGEWSILPFTLALWIGEVIFFTVAVLGLSVFLHQITRRRIRASRNSRLVNKCSAVAMGSAAVMIASR